MSIFGNISIYICIQFSLKFAHQGKKGESESIFKLSLHLIKKCAPTEEIARRENNLSLKYLKLAK